MAAKIKDKTKELRRATKEKHQEAMQTSLEKEDFADALYHSKASVSMCAKYHSELIMLLKYTGAAWSQSNGEADHKMAALFKSGKVDGVLTEDSDLLAHGVNKLYRAAPKNSKIY